MNFKVIHVYILILLVSYSCSKSGTNKNEDNITHNTKSLSFSSSDTALAQSFTWAQNMALSYAHDGTDPVGYWYEAALPSRRAFCMRDVSHQALGAEIVGLSKHNENMFTKFVSNISEGKDWCSFWEINIDDKPAPVDYTDDDHFWYNLNANFDIMQACLKLYEWTGNNKYLDDPQFINFFQKTLGEYVIRWQLEASKIMNRPEYLNVKDVENNAHRSTRGLPSYVENYPHLSASSDLIATIYAGTIAYSKIAGIKGNESERVKFAEKAQQYLNLLEDRWWDKEIGAYHTFWTSDRKFANGEGLTHVLWFDAVKNPEHIRSTYKKILDTQNWNVENRSHFPALFYRLNYNTEAYEELIALKTVPRCEYPEVSYGVIEGIVSGTMGIIPQYSQKTIYTTPKLTVAKENEWLELKNLPVFGGYISVRHNNSKSSSLTNDTNLTLTWKASFLGNHSTLVVDGKEYKAERIEDILGNKISYVSVELPVGKTMRAQVK